MRAKITLFGSILLAPLLAGCFDFSSTSSGGSSPDSGGSSGSSSGSSSGGSSGSSGGSSGGSGGFCARMMPDAAPMQGTYYCDDFDNGNFQPFWSLEQSNGSVRVDAVASEPNSTPYSMAANSGAAAAGASPPRAVAKLGFPNFSNSRLKLDVSFDMNVQQFDPTPASGKVIAFQLLYGPVDPNNFNQIAFNLVTNSAGNGVVAQVEENAPSPDGGDGYNVIGPFVAYPKVNGWSHVEIIIDILDPVGTGNSITVSIDGATNENALQVPLKGQEPRMELGIAGTPVPSQAWSIRYDNFVATLQ